MLEAGLAEEEGKISFDENNKVLLPKPVYKPTTNNQQPTPNSQNPTTNTQHPTTEVANYHIYNQYIIRVESRDELRNFLAQNEVATEIYYPVPFHLQECFSNLGYKKGDFPVAESAADTSIALPIYPELSNEQLKFVVDKIGEFLNA